MTKYSINYDITVEYAGDSVDEFYVHLAELHKLAARGQRLSEFRVRVEPYEEEEDDE